MIRRQDVIVATGTTNDHLTIDLGLINIDTCIGILRRHSTQYQRTVIGQFNISIEQTNGQDTVIFNSCLTRTAQNLCIKSSRNGGI